MRWDRQNLFVIAGFVSTYITVILPGFQGPVAQTLDSALHRINHYPADGVIDFRNTFPLDSDLSGG